MKGLVWFLRAFESTGSGNGNACYAGLIRHVLTGLGGVLISKGVIEQSDMGAGIGAIMTLLGIAWSMIVKQRSEDGANNEPALKGNSGEIILAICVGLAVASAGITWITANHNATLVTQAANGHVYAGVQGSYGPGVVAAVSQNKGQAALALLAGTVAGVATDQLQKKSEDKTSGIPPISNSGSGSIIINTGSGTAKQITTTTTGAP